MPTRPYATGTDVPTERSRSEIETTLERFGATGFMYGWTQDVVAVLFDMHGRRVRMTVPAPQPTDERFTTTPERALLRSDQAVSRLLEAERRRLWRALLLIIKAKLEAVSSGITTFETEFLPYFEVRTGGTVAEHLLPELDAYLSSGTQPLLPGPDIT